MSRCWARRPVLDLPAVPGRVAAGFSRLVWRGAFGSWFSLQNTVQRASPLLLTALCVALPGQLGLVIIGGEAAVVLGGLAGDGGGAAAGELPARWWSGSPWRWPGPRWARFWIGLSGWLRARSAASTRRSPAWCWPISAGAVQPFRRGRAARSGQPEQALHLRHRRRRTCSIPCRGWTCIPGCRSASSPACCAGC